MVSNHRIFSLPQETMSTMSLAASDAACEPVDTRDHQHLTFAEKVPDGEHATMTVCN